MRSLAPQPANEACRPCGPQELRTGISMLDILMLALAFGLFAAGIGYAYVCERL